MDEFLPKLRQQLISMVEEIDTYLKIDDEKDIIIKKEDFNEIKHLTYHVYDQLFEYKNGVKFSLSMRDSYPYEKEVYKKLMDGTLESLILNKRSEGSEIVGHFINYKVEDKIKTNLRNLYPKPDKKIE